ncbi:MAG: phosphoenolpyruvate--protein phosphotransferase [Clostridiales bacterium]
MTRTEVIGTSVSNGIGLGKIHILKQKTLDINKEKIDQDDTLEEIEKLETAINNAKIEIYDLKDSFRDSLSEHDNNIFEVYKMILKDKSFIREMKDLIELQLYHADYAVDYCISNYINALLISNNEYMKQRIHDLRDIKQRIIRNIHGEDSEEIDKIVRKQIIFVQQLTPSLAARIAKKKVMGVIAQEGAAYLSHAAIILRGLGIPALNNIKVENVNSFNEEFAVIDGDKGKIIVYPDKLELEKYRAYYKAGLKNYRLIFKEFLRRRKRCAVTTDGYKIDVTANIGNLQELDKFNDNDLDGIGLVRTELLFIKSNKMPDEKEQYNAYAKIVKKMNKKFVVIRTLDIGQDKAFNDINTKTNSSLEVLRGISFSLVQKDVFIEQIRAIMSTSELGDVRISFPMVNTVNEILKAKNIVREVYRDLVRENKPLRHVKLGATIETKEGVKNIRDILEHVDFISIGTNDMLEQFMGIDRRDFKSERIKSVLPEFLAIITNVITEAKRRNRRVSICGEIASDPLIAILLMGIGADELSMMPAKIDKICHIIRRVSLEEARKLAYTVLECDNIDAAEHILNRV